MDDPTERDLQVLRLLAEHRALCAAHVAAHLGVGAATAGNRLRRLHRAGLLRHEPIFKRCPATCWITHAGLKAIGSRLSEPEPDFKGYAHDLGVGWLWLAARDGAFGPIATMQSDREMRSHDLRAARTGRALGIGLGFPGPKGGEQRHYPDLVLELADGRRVAVELELTVKSRRRLDSIMRGYAGDRRIDAVLYLTSDPAVRRAVESAAARVGVGGLVHVQPLAPGVPHGAPDTGRASRRTPRRSVAKASGVRAPSRRPASPEREPG